MNKTVDLSLYPTWKTSTLSMIDELDNIYLNSSDETKASGFIEVFKKYDLLP